MGRGRPSIPQGICSLHHGCSRSVGASSYCFFSWMAEGGSKTFKGKGHCQVYSCREILFELSHENTGLKALHFHGKAKQFKVGLPLALSKLSKQSIFQKIEQISRVITDIKSIQNVLKDLLGQAGKGIGIFEFL